MKKQNTTIPILGQRQSSAHPLSRAGGGAGGRANGGAGEGGEPGGVGDGATGLSASRSLYIHVPFCFHKCHYCDFYSIVDARDRQGEFVERLIRELRGLSGWAGGEPLRTIFVGGGTPSLLRPELWRRVLGALGEFFDLGEIRAGRGEFTVECNPETVTAELAGVLREGGVDRASVGAQSFDPRHLKTLERWHDPENVGRSLDVLRGAGIARTSIDLIFGIPGQTAADWREDLSRALSLGLSHLSCYNLTYEPNTAMTKRLSLGHFEAADEDVELEMFADTARMLGGAGLARYEISNFAVRGQESRHNLAYWRQEQWLAAGPSASGHVGGWRWKNVARLDDYLNGEDGAGLPPAVDVEGPDVARALRERLMTGVRLAEGLDAAEMLGRARAVGGSMAEDRLAGAVEKLRREGLVEAEGPWRLTEAGVLLANRAATALMDAIDEE